MEPWGSQGLRESNLTESRWTDGVLPPKPTGNLNTHQHLHRASSGPELYQELATSHSQEPQDVGTVILPFYRGVTWDLVYRRSGIYSSHEAEKTKIQVCLTSESGFMGTSWSWTDRHWDTPLFQLQKLNRGQPFRLAGITALGLGSKVAQSCF